MKNNLVILELLKRQKCKKDNHNEIGSEIKYRRERASLTLGELSGEICSISYLSKIENCQLAVSRHYLEEICKKLKLDDKEFGRLYSLTRYLDETIMALLNEDNLKIKTIYENVKEFKNYKSRIIHMVYYISIGDYAEASNISKELNRIIGGMPDDAIVYYSTVLAYFRFKNGEYQEALDIIDSMGSFNKNVEVISLLNETTKFKCLFMLGDNNIFLAYNNLCFMLSNSNNFYLLEKFNYFINVYMIYSGSAYLNLNSYLTDESKKNLFLLKKIMDGEKPKFSEAKEATGMTRLYALSLIDRDRCIKELDDYRGIDINMEFSVYIIEYNLLDDEEKYSYIENKIVPILQVNNVFYMKKFFLNELAHLSKDKAKYKLFNMLYMEFFK